MTSRYVKANGQKLYCEIYGAGEPLILIMGLGGDLASWNLQVRALQAFYRVIVFDNRDVGRSSKVGGAYEIADMARDTAALMDELGIEQAHVLGASMGGAIAQELAISFPDKVRMLILACTAAQFARFHVSLIQPWAWLVQHDRDLEILPIHMVTLCMTGQFQENAEAVEKMISLIRNHPFSQPPDAFQRQATALSRFDATARLRTVESPTLVLVGDQDILTPPWLAGELAAAIPKARLQILNGGGHGFMWEIPDQFNQAVVDFLSRT